MSYELSYDVLRSAQLAYRLQASEAELRISEQRMSLAISATLDEVRDILEDIAADDKRAGEVIHRLRLLPRCNTIHIQFVSLVFFVDQSPFLGLFFS
jgi:hypothetical protein